MRRLILWGAVLAVLWCGYWAVGTYALRAGVATGIDDALRAGRLFAEPEVQAGGFPTAFSVALRNLDAGDPVRGLRWQSPSVRFDAPLWRPWHVEARLEGAQQLTLPDQTMALIAQDLRASLTARPNRRLTLTQASVVLALADLQSSQGWRVGAGRLQGLARLLPDTPASYSLALEAVDLRPDPVLAAMLGLGPAVERADIAATVTLTAPLDLASLQPPPDVQKVSVSGLQLVWGPVQVMASGDIRANADGLAEGRIDIRIAGWRAMVAAAVGAGVITAATAPTVEGVLGAMAAQAGNPEVLALPLVFAAGRGTLGPLPLGPAPRLQQRVQN